MPDADPSAAVSPARRAAEEGIALCRRGRWREGHRALARAAAAERAGDELPSLFYSYLGYTVAWREGRPAEGLVLCRRAVELEFFQPESHVNLARVYLLREQTGAAVRALAQALALDPEHRAALRLQRRIGVRLPPVVRFLDRGNPLNMLLGRVRALLRR